MSALATLLVRFLGVWLIVAQAAPSFPYAILMVVNDHAYGGSFPERVGEASLALFPAVIGLVLIVSARPLASKLTAGLPEGAAPVLSDRRVLERTGTFLLGLYVVAFALPVVAAPLVQFASVAATDHSASLAASLSGTAPEFGWALGELVIGLVLILVSRRT